MADIDQEKAQYTVGAESPDHGVKEIVERKGAALGEAADLYGDVQTAEEYGYVERGLKSRHIQFIALVSFPFAERLLKSLTLRPGWYHWHGSLLRYRYCVCACRSPFRSSWLYVYWCRYLRHDAMPG